MRQLILTILCFGIMLTGCAAMEMAEPRWEYILANDHGWIEIEMKHPGIQSISDPEEEAVIPHCSISIKINNEPFIIQTVYPFGEDPNYQVDTGFRFPVPVGEMDLTLRYKGCSGYETTVDDDGIERRVYNDVVLNYIVEVKKDMVTELFFDGTELSSNGINPNKKVTLEDVNDQLNRIEQMLKNNKE